LTGDVDYGVWTAGQVIGLIHGNSFFVFVFVFIFIFMFIFYCCYFLSLFFCFVHNQLLTRYIADIPTCKELITRIEQEAEESFQRIGSLIVPKSKL
jgi:hypothetical protein